MLRQPMRHGNSRLGAVWSALIGPKKPVTELVPVDLCRSVEVTFAGRGLTHSQDQVWSVSGAHSCRCKILHMLLDLLSWSMLACMRQVSIVMW